MFRRIQTLVLAGILGTLMLAACGVQPVSPTVNQPQPTAAVVESTVSETLTDATNNVAEAAATTSAPAPVAQVAIDPATADATITLSDDDTTIDGEGATMAGNVVTISAGGTYLVSGDLADGQLLVDAADADVALILADVTVENSTGAPLYIKEASTVTLSLAAGTDNVFGDGETYVYANPEDDEPNAAVFSDADMVIGGEGTLVVDANFNDGITSKDTLTITGGTFVVNAADDGIRGKDSLVIQGGNFTVDAGGDGLKADNEDDPTLGTIAISGGAFTLTTGGDAIAAETGLAVSGGEFAIAAGGGSGAPLAEDVSAKGVKAGADLLISGGTWTIDAADDGVHSNTNITIDGGTLTIATGDDGVHADETLTINDGNLLISRSVEGLEGALITINDGTIDVIASDDGINVSSDAVASSGQPGRGMTAADYSGSLFLIINGGTVTVNAEGDGLDSNGAILMTGGVVVVHGPVVQMEGPLDFDGGFAISGGELTAAGSAGMALAPDTSSTQNSMIAFFDGAQPARSVATLVDTDGVVVMSFTAEKPFESLVFSSPGIVTGQTYSLQIDGTEAADFTVSSVVTQLGNGGMGGPGRGPGG